MTTIEVFPTPEQELVLDDEKYGACICLGDVTICIPGGSHEERTDWLMGFWEQLADYMAEYADKEHLTDCVKQATKQGENK